MAAGSLDDSQVVLTPTHVAPCHSRAQESHDYDNRTRPVVFGSAPSGLIRVAAVGGIGGRTFRPASSALHDGFKGPVHCSLSPAVASNAAGTLNRHKGREVMAIRVMLMGLGPIGAGVARQVADRKGLRIVGAVDIDPAKAGRDVGDVVGLGRKLRVKVNADVAATLRATKPDVAVLCTGSSLKKVLPQFEAVLKARVPIVSTTEELAYPWFSNRSLARKLDQLARKAKVAVVGTGVNPGFAMDALPITLSGICERVDTVRVDRIQDASIRRLPFQKKIGAGMTHQEFMEQVQQGTVRHVGLTESIAMIADALGWKLDEVTDEIAPKLAEQPVKSQFLEVPQGRVCGLIQDGIGYRGGEPVIVLHMEAYLGAPETYDAVTIEGSPRLSVRAEGGFHGDIATTSITVNSIPKVIDAPAGLHTMRSLPIPSFFGGRPTKAKAKSKSQ